MVSMSTISSNVISEVQFNGKIVLASTGSVYSLQGQFFFLHLVLEGGHEPGWNQDQPFIHWLKPMTYVNMRQSLRRLQALHYRHRMRCIYLILSSLGVGSVERLYFCGLNNVMPLPLMPHPCYNLTRITNAVLPCEVHGCGI